MRALLSLICLAFALSVGPAFTQTPSAVAVAPLAYMERTLPNGLRVYALPNADTATVSVQVWYKVGSKDDPAGRSGFAHLFEHIMFKATENMAPEQFDRLTEDVGGFNNASTWDDFTNYYAVVPANHLERILWAEADRMRSLVVQEEFFKSERDVVKEEYRQGILAQPYGRLFGLYLVQTAFQKHPYGRPGIGSLEDLDAATIDDVRAFHATYYRPDNAVLVVAGRFEPAQLNAWVDQYFGKITRPNRPIPRVTLVEPARTGPKEYSTFAPNVPLPAALVHYPAPAATHPDTPALMVLDAILSKGESSRLYQSLVYDQQIAADIFTQFEQQQDATAFALGAILSEGKSVDEGVTALLAEVARLRRQNVTAAELDEAKNQIITDALENRETAYGRAYELADAVIRFGDARRADTLLADIQKVKASDIRRAARAWLRDNQRVVIRYQAEETKAAGARADQIASAATIEAQKLSLSKADIPLFALALEATRQSPPNPGAAVSARIPAIVERKLSNGLRVMIAPNRNLPLISADLRILTGSSADPAGKAGLAGLTADLVTKGAGDRNATEIAQAVEALGASLSAGAGPDSATVSLTTRADRADAAFALLADVARKPTFAGEELDRQRQQALDGLSVSLRQPRALGGFAMTRLVYGAGPYGGVGTEKTLTAVQANDVAGFHKAHWRPDNSLLVISGDVSPEQGLALAERFFGDWAKPEGALPAEPPVATAGAAPRALVIDLPESGQAAVLMGSRALSRTDAGFFPALVANSVLGGGYSARLSQEIRIKRGLSYGAGSGLQARLGPGALIATAQTKNESAVEVVDLMRSEFARLGSEPIGKDEFTARKAALIGAFGRDVETNSGLAAQVSAFAAFGLNMDRLRSYVADIEAVTPQQVGAAASTLTNPANAHLIVVGDGRKFFDALKAKYPSVELIGVDALNLDSATLK